MSDPKRYYQLSNENSAGSSSEIPLPPIFNLIVDCFKELFEYLSVQDLKTLRRTCTRMKQEVDDYIKTHFTVTLQHIRILNFGRDGNQQWKRLLGPEVASFKLVNNIDFAFSENNLAVIENVRNILPQIETISIHAFDHLECDIYNELLKNCTRMKHLILYLTNINIENGLNWRRQVYPNLEHIGLYHCSRVAIEPWTDLDIFFKKNQIQHFTVTSEIIWANRDWIRKSSIGIDRLYVVFRHLCSDEFFNFLVELHHQGFYKRLHVEIQSSSLKFELNSILELGALEALFNVKVQTRLNLIELSLTHLKEIDLDLQLFEDHDVSDWEKLAINLPNLQRITVHMLSKFDHILPFIKRCPKLTHIKISSRKNDCNLTSLNLTALNKERKKLDNARKVMIFVDEDIFLKKKWGTEVNLKLITLKRSHSWENSNIFHPI